MKSIPDVAFLFAAVSLAAVSLAGVGRAQGSIGPSVLSLQASYHIGVYSAAISVPSGAIQLLSHNGTLNLTSAGGLSGALNTYEWTMLGGAFTPNDPVVGTYHVSPDGQIQFDLDPVNPGTDVLDAFLDTGGTVMHAARSVLDSEAFSVLVLQKSSGHSNASLNGTYRFYGQRMELTGNSMETTSERGAATFDGAGSVAFSGTELFAASSGVTSTSPIAGTASYSVAADGALVLDGGPGAISANGELFFAMTGSLTSSEVGMLIGVRMGSSYDHNNLIGRYSLHGQKHVLGTSPGLPRTVTERGVVHLAAANATTGSWAIAGENVSGNASGQVLSPMTGSGATSLAINGTMTLSFATSGGMEMAFSDSGTYAIGRAIENNTNLYFAMRACPENYGFGSGTAGTGGREPVLGMRTFPTLGNAAWRFAITNGLGGAAAILPIGFAASPVGIALSGGQLWLDPLAIVATPFVVLGGAVGIAGAGSVDLPLAIPSHPSYAGLELFAQALVLDPGAPATVAMSRGFAVEFCR